ncbi:MAG: NUDIX domain-containing protein [Candidatus Dormibacteria bacterium]
MPRLGAAVAVVGRGAGREQVLVLPRARALPGGAWQGLRLGGVAALLEAVTSHGQFRSRAEVESDREWQQIIPHLIVREGPRVLTMRRLRKGSERRLRGQVTLGVGGHVNQGDGDPGSAWLRGCAREWSEEVVCGKELTARGVGLLKDEAGPVGQVHLGVLLLVEAEGAEVTVRERDKLEGRMVPLEELGVYYLEMETWSQFVYDALLQGLLEGASGPGLALPPSPPLVG